MTNTTQTTQTQNMTRRRIAAAVRVRAARQLSTRRDQSDARVALAQIVAILRRAQVTA